jgi:hypothetical protein
MKNRLTQTTYHPTAHSNFRIREEHWQEILIETTFEDNDYEKPIHTERNGKTTIRFAVQQDETEKGRWRLKGHFKPTLEAAQREVESVRKRIEGGKTGYQKRQAPK